MASKEPEVDLLGIQQPGTIVLRVGGMSWYATNFQSRQLPTTLTSISRIVPYLSLTA